MWLSLLGLLLVCALSHSIYNPSQLSVHPESGPALFDQSLHITSALSWHCMNINWFDLTVWKDPASFLIWARCPLQHEGEEDNRAKQETGDTWWERKLTTQHVLWRRSKGRADWHRYSLHTNIDIHGQTLTRLTLIGTCPTPTVLTDPKLFHVSGQQYLEWAGRQSASVYILAPICQHRKNLTYTLFVPHTVPSTDGSSAVRFNTRLPGGSLPAKVRMKEDTGQVQTENSAYYRNACFLSERTKEITGQEITDLVGPH